MAAACAKKWAVGRTAAAVFCEAAIAKDALAREALFRIHRFFENERAWSGVPPA